MDYKLNLLTPCLYSKEGPSNCIDKLVEEFADYIRHRAYNEFNFRCNYNKIPGLAFIHNFEDFENRFLIHSEYAVIIASPYSQKALNQFVPRLLVFLTAKPIWQNRFLFICLGEVKILDNLVVNEPIQFSLDNWEAKDEESWKSFFNLIKITWKPHIEEECLGHKTSLESLSNPLFQKKPPQGNKENTNIENQVQSKCEVKIFESKSIQGPVVTLEQYIFVGDNYKANKNKVFNKSASVQTDYKYVEEINLNSNSGKKAKRVDYSSSSLESDENSDNSEQTFECQPIISQYLNSDISEDNDIELNSESAVILEDLNSSHFESKNRSNMTPNITNKTDESGDSKMQTLETIDTTKHNPSDNVLEDIDSQRLNRLNIHEDDYLEKDIIDTPSSQGILNRNSTGKGTFDNLNESLVLELENDELRIQRNIISIHDNQDMTDSHSILPKNDIEISNFKLNKESEENKNGILVNETGLKEVYDICSTDGKINSPIFDDKISENNTKIISSVITSKSCKNLENNEYIGYEEKAILEKVNANKSNSENNLVPENRFIKENDFEMSISSMQVDTTKIKESLESNIPYQIHSDVHNVASGDLNNILKNSDNTPGPYIGMPSLHDRDDNNNNKLQKIEVELSDIIFEENDISRRIPWQENDKTISLKTKFDNKLIWKQPYLSNMITLGKDIFQAVQEQENNEMTNSINKSNNRLRWKVPHFADVIYEEMPIFSKYQDKENNITSMIHRSDNEKYNETIDFEENRQSNKSSLKDRIFNVDKEHCVNDNGINFEIENEERKAYSVLESNCKTNHELVKNNRSIEPVSSFAEEIGIIEERENIINYSDILVNEQEQAMTSISKSMYLTNVDFCENEKDYRDSYNSNKQFESALKNEKESHTNMLFSDLHPDADFKLLQSVSLYDNYSPKHSIQHSSQDSNNLLSRNDTLHSHASSDTDSTSKENSRKNKLSNSDTMFEETGNSEVKSYKSNIESAGKEEIKSHISDKVIKTSAQAEDQSMEIVSKSNRDMNHLMNEDIFTQSQGNTTNDFHEIEINTKYSCFENNALHSVDLDSNEKDTGYSEYSSQDQHDKTEDKGTFHKDKNNNAEISNKVHSVFTKNFNNNIIDNSTESKSENTENLNSNLSNDSPFQLNCLDTSLPCFESSIENIRNILEVPALSTEMINDQIVIKTNKWTPEEYVSKETSLKENNKIFENTKTYHKNSPIDLKDENSQFKSTQEGLNTKLYDSFPEPSNRTNIKEEFSQKNIKSENEYYNPDEQDKNLSNKENTLENRDLIQNSIQLYDDPIEITDTSLRVLDENQFHLRSSFQLFTNTFELAHYIQNISRDFTFSVSNNIESTIVYGTRSLQNYLRNWFPRNSFPIAQSDESQIISERISLIESLYSPWCVLLFFITGTLISPYWVSFTNGYHRSGSSLFFMNPIPLSVLQDENSSRKFPFLHKKFRSTFFAFGLTVYKKNPKT